MPGGEKSKGAEEQVFVDNQVALVEPLLKDYDEFSKALERVLNQAVKDLGIIAIVQVRTKTIPSFAEKCLRKRDAYRQPAYQFGDLCGGRVIVESRDKIPLVCQFIRDHFEVEESTSEDVAERLHAQEFGYQSVHFTVSFREDIAYPGLAQVPPVLLERRGPQEAQTQELPVGPKYRAEIQVRTLLQHAWADLVHDNLYKAEMKKKPRHLEREAGRIAALLEDADNGFVRMLEGVNAYRSCFGAYMEKGDIRKEIAILDMVRKHDKSESLAHKIARLAMAAELWEKAASSLTPFADSKNAALRRDLGWSLWRANQRDSGRRNLEEAVDLDPSDADAHCALGDTYNEEQNRHEALRHYKNAFNADPRHPRALLSYISCEMIENRNLAFLVIIRPTLEEAIALSAERARYGMHLPWAWYDIGFMHLLLGNPYPSLTAYLKAAQLSATETPIVQARALLDDIQRAALGRNEELERHARWARWLLSALIVSKLNTMETQALAEKNKAANEKRNADAKVNELSKDSSAEDADKARADAAANALQEAEARYHEIRDKAAAAPATWLCRGDKELDKRECLASTLESGVNQLFNKALPVVILAGGCDASVQARIDEYRLLVHQAFDGFKGTIISGGTTAGIPGIAGDIPADPRDVTKAAYLPAYLPIGDQKHPNYNPVRTSNETGYSPLDPIQAWIDLLAAGIKPADVRLIGINGGQISAFEYRLALVMGAWTGILRDSGREASRIAEDPDWMDNKRLLLMPTDQETLVAFLAPPEQSALITPEKREEMARHAHEGYKKEQEKRYLRQHPPMAEWDRLSETYRNANLTQIDHIEAKLRRVGLGIRKATQTPPTTFEFTDAQKRIMAEMEHGRWNTERLREGWTYGPVKDEEKKIQPYLIAWHDLPENIKQYDIDAVEKIPAQLALAGYEIYDLKK